MTELLTSLSRQTDKDFEVLVIDDGSAESLAPIVTLFEKLLKVEYYYKKNEGPGKARNYGMERAKGNYFIFLDSDTIVPDKYISIIRNELHSEYVDLYGGPDDAHIHFSDLQKAISFSMTSFWTTGGIRGGRRHIGKFQPRSFNMGISERAYQETGGFGNLRIGEDPDLSMTISEKGFSSRLIPEAKVFHKRRTDMHKFAKQVFKFGIARPILNQHHPEYAKLAFWFPSFFLIGFLISVIIYVLSFFMIRHWNLYLKIPIIIFLLYCLGIFIAAFVKSWNIKVALLSIITSLIQLCGYGLGFLKSWYCLNVLKQRAENIFPRHFYLS